MPNSMATVDHVQELEKMDIERNLSVTSSRNMNILSLFSGRRPLISVTCGQLADFSTAQLAYPACLNPVLKLLKWRKGRGSWLLLKQIEFCNISKQNYFSFCKRLFVCLEINPVLKISCDDFHLINISSDDL